MAEITESSPQEQQNQQQFNPDTMRTARPGRKRLLLTLSVFFSFVLGFPFLWKSIEIYRAPLPFSDIDLLSRRIESDPLKFPCNFQAVFIGFDMENFRNLYPPERVQSLIMNQMNELTAKALQHGSCSGDYTVSVIVESNSGCVQSHHGGELCSYQCGMFGDVDFDGKDDNYVDDMLESVLGRCSGFGRKVYNVIIVNKDVEVRSVVGKHRNAWIVGRVSEEEAVARIGEIFVKVFVDGGQEKGLIPGEYMPVGADGKIVISLNLLNSDPVDWIYDWDFDWLDKTVFSPIAEALGSIANITVESQVLYHTPKSSFSYWDDNLQSHIFKTNDLPFFVNSNEWHLDTSTGAGGRSKILQLVVYVPSAKEWPLRLQLTDGAISKTNGFVSPMWGGIMVWNPPNSSWFAESRLPSLHKISAQDLQLVSEVFIGQIRQLFGLKSDNIFIGTSGRLTVLASEKGFAEWELDFLSRQHVSFNLRSCATTLGSLSRLVQSLPRMIIIDEIGKQVKFSLEAAKQAETEASLGKYDASAASSKQARSRAEDAFFHPSITSVSYYSFEHCFAVYSPFFLPVSLHVLLATLRELKRYRLEKKKYSSWKPIVDSAS